MSGREFDVVVDLSAEDGRSEVVTKLRYKLDRCWIKSWSTTSAGGSAVPTEQLTLNYEKVVFID